MAAGAPIITPRCKPWQYGDMNLYRSIRNSMLYWYARVILEQGSRDAMALACRIHPLERAAIVRMSRRRAYWRFREAGNDSIETRALMEGNENVAAVREREKRRKKSYRARWGGDPRAGTNTYNRWVLTK